MGNRILANLRKTTYFLKRNGLQNTFYAVFERLAKQQAYQYLPETEETLQKQRACAGSLSKIKISILVPTYRTPRTYLKEMIESVRQQTYPNWELLLADASGDNSVRSVWEEYHDERIRYLKLEKNEGIAQNTQAGLSFVTGEYVGLLDHDDFLTPNALFEMVTSIEEAKKRGISLKLIYSDEDKCNGDGTDFYEPNQKEDYNFDLLLSNNYICHFLILERRLLEQLGFRGEYNGAQDFDLVLRAAYALWGKEEEIAHVRKVLYHWRCHSNSTAENPRSKEYAYEAGKRAVEDFVKQKGWSAQVMHTAHLGFYRVAYQEDIFAIREDVGAVGGPILSRGKIVSGRMDEKGKVFYRQLPKNFSGPLHRAVLHQDAAVLDIRNLKVRKEFQERYEQILHSKGTTLEKSLLLSREITEKGYRLLYLPDQRKKCREEER